MSAALPLFRIEADWVGGGFSVTMPFADAEAAAAWAVNKASAHPGAAIKVTPRITDDKLASMFAGPRFDLSRACDQRASRREAQS